MTARPCSAACGEAANRSNSRKACRIFPAQRGVFDTPRIDSVTLFERRSVSAATRPRKRHRFPEPGEAEVRTRKGPSRDDDFPTEAAGVQGHHPWLPSRGPPAKAWPRRSASARWRRCLSASSSSRRKLMPRLANTCAGVIHGASAQEDLCADLWDGYPPLGHWAHLPPSHPVAEDLARARD